MTIADEAEAKTQARLDADPAYRAQRESAEEAERPRAPRRTSAERQRKEREKAKAYRGRPTFRYL